MPSKIDDPEPESRLNIALSPSPKASEQPARNGKKTGGWLQNILSPNKLSTETSLREALEEVIEGFDEQTEIAAHERSLIKNVLNLRDMTVFDVMIPRVDVIAVAEDTSKEDLFAVFAEKQFSRLPVYRDSLDEVIGTIHIKDILAALVEGKELKISDLVKQVPIISPAMPALDLLLQMRQTTRHMAMVVDEYGGIDGLVTIGDLVESIVGEIDDEFQQDQQPEIIVHEDGSITADARYDLEAFEEEFGTLVSQQDTEDIDTLAGLVFNIAGRIPARGEVLTLEHNGVKFEVVEANERRVNRLRIRNLPSTRAAE